MVHLAPGGDNANEMFGLPANEVDKEVPPDTNASIYLYSQSMSECKDTAH